MRAHRSRRPRAPAKRHSVKISLDGGDEKLPSHNGELYASNGFDVDRLVRFMAWGTIMAPVQLAWFAWLSETFPLSEESKTGMAMWRVICDQVFFAPIGKLCCGLGRGKGGVLMRWGVLCRFGGVFCVHDALRDGRTEGGDAEAGVGVLGRAEVELCCLASGADRKLPLDASSVADRKFKPGWRWDESTNVRIAVCVDGGNLLDNLSESEERDGIVFRVEKVRDLGPTTKDRKIVQLDGCCITEDFAVGSVGRSHFWVWLLFLIHSAHSIKFWRIIKPWYFCGQKTHEGITPVTMYIRYSPSGNYSRHL